MNRSSIRGLNHPLQHLFCVDLQQVRPCLIGLKMRIPRLSRFIVPLSLLVAACPIGRDAMAQGFIQMRDIQNLHGRADMTFEAGDFEMARKIYQNVLGYRMRRQGAKAYEIGAIHNNLGVMHYNEGDYEKAVELYEQAILIIRGTKGGEHPDLATTLCNKGFAKIANGEHELALESFQAALKARLRRLGQSHPDVADCHEGLGLYHSAKNESDKAIAAFQKCLDIRVKSFGEEHVETAAAYMGLGMAYLGKNDFEKAEEFDSKSKAILKKTGGVTTINRNPQSQLKGPVVQVFKARSKLKRKP